MRKRGGINREKDRMGRKELAELVIEGKRERGKRARLRKEKMKAVGG